MARYRRINLDGKSNTRTAIGATALLPGSLVVLAASGLFGLNTVTLLKPLTQLYVVNTAYHQGLTSDEAIPVGDSVVGDYFEEGRELAVLVESGTVLVEGSPLTTSPTGTLILATGTNVVVAHSQDALTVGAADELVRVRVA